MKLPSATTLVVILLLASTLAVLPGARAAVSPRPGAYVDQITWFQQTNQAQALLDLQSGTMDMYVFQLRTITDIKSAKSNPNLNTVDTAGSLNNLFLNPVPVNQTLAPGKVNPFAFREVREAMNYLIDRKYIVNQIFGGAGQTHTTLWWSQHPEFGRDAVYFSTEDRKYTYNPTTAKSMIASGMAKLGATQVNGQWIYNGQQVNINLVQRTEDARFDMGNYIADQLRSAGFQVTLIPKSGSGAFAIVYNGPPDNGAWHAYTEGWAVTGLSAWADGDPYFYFNGGEGSNIWNFYKPSLFPLGSPERKLADATTKLFESNYTSLQERESLIEQAVDLSLKNSVRVWLYAGATFASSKRVTSPSPGVGYVYDLAGGPWSLYSIRSARFDTNGGNLKVGQRLMFISTWNPWKGFSFLYDGLQAQAFQDLAVWVDPHTGLYIPLRANFDVTTAGPTDKLDVPGDAIIWRNNVTSLANSAFVQVGSGLKATSKVKYTFTFSKWHDGQPMNMNDVLHELSLWGRFTSSGDVYPHDQDAQNTAILLFNQIVKGYRVVDANTLEVYGDYWHVDPSTIAATLAGVACGGNGCDSIFPTIPWEVAELGLAPVLADKVKISEDSAVAAGVDPLDISKGPSLSFSTCTGTQCMDSALPIYKAANRRPIGSQNTSSTSLYYVSDVEASARWAALQAWKTAHGHYFVSNGPFYLDQINLADPINPQTIMKRVYAGDIKVGYDYPYMSDRWDYRLIPKIPKVQIGTVPQVVPGIAANVSVSTTFAGTAYDQLTMVYQVQSPATGAFLLQGDALNVAPGTWNVSLSAVDTAKLGQGSYTLQVIAVGLEAAVPVTSTASLLSVSPLTILEGLLTNETAKLRGDITDLQTQLNTEKAQAASTQTTLTALLIVAFAVAGISLALNFLSMRNLNRKLDKMSPQAGVGALPVGMEERRK